MTGHGREGAPAPAAPSPPISTTAAQPGRAPDAGAGVQRLLDAWGRATLAERNAFLWLAAEEIQAAQEGEFQNALTTPQARGNGPSFRASDGSMGRERAYDGLSSADLAAAEAEANAWLDEEAEQARLWRDDAAAAYARGIPRPWEQLKRSFASQPGEDAGQPADSTGAQGNSPPRN